MRVPPAPAISPGLRLPRFRLSMTTSRARSPATCPSEAAAQHSSVHIHRSPESPYAPSVPQSRGPRLSKTSSEAHLFQPRPLQCRTREESRLGAATLLKHVSTYAGTPAAYPDAPT